jgi:hypothetical protein
MRRTIFGALLLALALTAPAYAQREWPGGDTFRGTEATVDLPADQHVRNTVGIDRAGLCVFASMDMAARYQNVRGLIDVMNRMARSERGGGWPAKVDAMVKKYGGVPTPELVQYEGSDPSILDLAMRTGRPVCVTYGYGDFYGRQTIAHMVFLAHLDAEWAAVIDNNNPAYFTWMSRAEFLRRWKHPQGYGWAFVLLASPPPPAPKNAPSK